MIQISKIDPDVLYTEKEASALICKSTAWFQRHRWLGTGPAYVKGRPILYSGQALRDWLQGNIVQTKGAAA